MTENRKTVIITGAAQGLGKALSMEFLAKGWNIIATDVIKPSFAGPPDRFLSLQMDVTSDDSVARATEDSSRVFGKLDLIINNAGIDRYMLLSEADVYQFKNVFEVNVFGAYRVNRLFLPLLNRPGGRILLIGSESLNLAMPFMAYPLSKKLLEGYAKALRQELKFRGVDVIVIRPGAMDTNIVKELSRLPAFPPEETAGDPLRRAFNSFTAQAAKEVGRIISTEKAAGYIFRVSVQNNPRPVYRINNMLQLKIAALLPYWLQEKIVLKRLGWRKYDK